jgi:transcriptional regulator with XRE-family HTH domain
VRAALGLTPAEVARALRIGRATYYPIERPGGDGPPGLLLALAGLAVAPPGWSAADVAALVGIDPDADPPRSPDGRVSSPTR